MDKVLVVLVIVGIALAVVVPVSLFVGWLVMLLWNWVMVDAFGLPSLSFWQAVGLWWLTSLLFGGAASASRGGKS